MLRAWNISLLCSTFSLTILGTFLARSGVIDSVHAFSSGSIGPTLLGFFAVGFTGAPDFLQQLPMEDPATFVRVMGAMPPRAAYRAAELTRDSFHHFAPER